MTKIAKVEKEVFQESQFLEICSGIIGWLKNSSISKSSDRNKLQNLISSSKSAFDFGPRPAHLGERVRHFHHQNPRSHFFSFCANSDILSSCVSKTYDPRKNSSISKSYDGNKVVIGVCCGPHRRPKRPRHRRSSTSTRPASTRATGEL